MLAKERRRSAALLQVGAATATPPDCPSAHNALYPPTGKRGTWPGGQLHRAQRRAAPHLHVAEPVHRALLVEHGEQAVQDGVGLGRAHHLAPVRVHLLGLRAAGTARAALRTASAPRPAAQSLLCTARCALPASLPDQPRLALKGGPPGRLPARVLAFHPPACLYTCPMHPPSLPQQGLCQPLRLASHASSAYIYTHVAATTPHHTAPQPRHTSEPTAHPPPGRGR